MNPTDWQYTNPRQWDSLDPRLSSDSRENTENASHCGYYAANDNRPHTMMATANDELEHHNPSSHNDRSYMPYSNLLNPNMVTLDPGSEPEEMRKIDEELARKRRELQQIEKQILHKKSLDAIKNTGPATLKAKTPCHMFKEDCEGHSHSGSVKNTKPAMSTPEKDEGFSSKSSSACNNGLLKERVNVVLQQHWSDGFLAKAYSTPSGQLPSHNPVEKMNTLNRDDHPLKVRVKALMNTHRHSGLLDSHGEDPVKPPYSCESPSNTVMERKVVNGFQRFLSILNKGVDIEMLTKIVNKDSVLPPTGQKPLYNQPPVVKERTDVCKSESQQLRSGAGQRDRSCSEERKTDLSSQEVSHGQGKRNNRPAEISTNGDDRSSSSPLVVEKKPKLEQHQEQLQNILETIGFSLDADDMCKMAERTKERLYGIKHETKQELARKKVSKKHQQNPQSIQSPPSSFTSGSDSPRSSPSSHQHSSSKTFRDSRERTQSYEYQHSRPRSKNTGGAQEREQDHDKDNHTIVSRDGGPGHHLYPETPECLISHPDAASSPMCHFDSGSANPTYHSDYGSAIPTYHFEAGSAIPTYHSDTGSAIPTYHVDSGSAIPTYNSDTACAIPTSNFDDTSAIPTNTSVKQLRKELDAVGMSITLVSSNPANVSDKEIKFLQELSRKKHSLLKRLEQITGLGSHFHTGHQSDLCYPHAINTVQNSEYTTYHSDTSRSAFSTAWNHGCNVIPPSSSDPPVFCDYSMNRSCPPPDTGVLFGQDYPGPYIHPYPPAGCNTALGQSHFNGQNGWSLPHNNNVQLTHVFQKKKKKKKKKKNTVVSQTGKPMTLSEELKFVINSIAQKKPAPVTNSKAKPKILDKTAGVEQKTILKKLNEGIPGQQAPASPSKKAPFQTEERIMEQNEGQKDSQGNIQGQQDSRKAEVALPTEEEINVNLLEKESPANNTASHTGAATACLENTVAPGENDSTVPDRERQKEDAIRRIVLQLDNKVAGKVSREEYSKSTVLLAEDSLPVI